MLKMLAKREKINDSSLELEDIKDLNTQQNLLHIAIKEDYLGVIKYLFEHHTDSVIKMMNQVDIFGMKPLDYYTNKDKKNTVFFLASQFTAKSSEFLEHQVTLPKSFGEALLQFSRLENNYNIFIEFLESPYGMPRDPYFSIVNHDSLFRPDFFETRSILFDEQRRRIRLSVTRLSPVYRQDFYKHWDSPSLKAEVIPQQFYVIHQFHSNRFISVDSKKDVFSNWRRFLSILEQIPEEMAMKVCNSTCRSPRDTIPYKLIVTEATRFIQFCKHLKKKE